jgi:hypothetical protein
MPNPSDYLASSLVNGEEEDEGAMFWAGPEHGWVRGTPGGEQGPLMGGTPGGQMGPGYFPQSEVAPPVAPDPEAESHFQQWLAAVRSGNVQQASVLSARAVPGFDTAAAVGAHPMIQKPIGAVMDAVGGMSSEEKARKGLLGQASAGFQAGLNTFEEEAGKVYDPIMDTLLGTDRNLPSDQDADKVGQNIVPPTIEPTVDTEAVSSSGRLGYRDGVFVNNATDEEANAYRGGVSDFRERMRADQAGYGPPPPDQILSGAGEAPRVREGGHMMGNPDAPLPGDDDYMEGGAVSYPGGTIADPTARLTEEGWAAMTPGGKDEYLTQVGEVSAARQAHSQGELATEEARRATDPEYAVRQRFGPYFSFYQMGEERNKELIDKGLAKLVQRGLVPGTPDYNIAAQTIKDGIIQPWLEQTHGSLAPWDEIFAKGQGLTF